MFKGVAYNYFRVQVYAIEQHGPFGKLAATKSITPQMMNIKGMYQGIYIYI